MLRGQMYMSPDGIKIALSQLQDGKGRIVKGTFTEWGRPSVLTEIPVNGYTLYAEEPLNLRSGTELEGRTMYMTPTSPTALKWNNSTSIPRRRGGAPYTTPTSPTALTGKNPNSIPQRRGGALYISISGKGRIVNNMLSGKDGTPTKFYFPKENGKPY